MKPKTGTLYGIGVGPGDPELLTLKAAKILSQVDVVFAAASTKNNHSLAVNIARPHIPEHTAVQMLRFPMTRDKHETGKAWCRHAQTIVAEVECSKNVAFLTLAFPDKKVAHVHLSWLDPHKIRKFTIVGNRKMAVFDDMATTEKIRVYDKGVETPVAFTSFGENVTLRFGDIHIPKIDLVEPLRKECQHFVDCNTTNTPPRSDGDNGLAVVEIINAAEESIAMGGKPVELPK